MIPILLLWVSACLLVIKLGGADRPKLTWFRVALPAVVSWALPYGVALAKMVAFMFVAGVL